MLMVRRYLAAAIRDAFRIELRSLLRSLPPTSEVFDNVDALLEAARGKGDRNLYVTLNRPHADAVVPFNDADISTIVRIPFDFDPPRPADTNSTDAELRGAENAALETANLLRGFGWPSPARGMSGNGHHLVYRCALPNDATTKALLKRLYEGLHDRCSMFDLTVRNPSRIFRLYGTLNRKALHTRERPQRTATVWVPDRWDVVSPHALARAVDALAPAPPRVSQIQANPGRQGKTCNGAGDFQTLDIVRWFTAHGLYRFDMSGGKHSVTCPWADEHSTTGKTDTVVWERGDSGWPVFHCSHAHCNGRRLLDVARIFGDAEQFCAEVRHA